MIGQTTLKKVETLLTENLQQELRDEGHYLTGTLEDSLTGNTSTTNNSVVLEINAAGYMNPVNDGVPAERIPYDPNTSTGAKHSKYIEGLKNYAKLRFGLNDEKEALSAAFAIARKHAKEGMPTSGSFAFSSNGRRTEAIRESYAVHEHEIDAAINEGLSSEVDSFIDETFDETVF